MSLSADELALCSRAALVLRQHESRLVSRVSQRCFSELESYRRDVMPRQESVGATGRLLHYLIDGLEQVAQGRVAGAEFSSFCHNELTALEQDIAARRVVMAIDFQDLLRGLGLMRVELWKLLRSELGSASSTALWEIEGMVNGVFDHVMIGLASSYLTAQAEQIALHEASLAKWDEVVKSASQIRLKIPSKVEYAAVVRLQAEAIARRVRFDEEDVYDIVTAVGEVCDNALEHGASELGADVDYVMSEEALTIEVRDYGVGFSYHGQGDAQPDLLAESGRGLFLMKNLMDDLSIESSLGSGTRVRMSKRRRV